MTMETIASMAKVFQLQGQLYLAIGWDEYAMDGFRNGHGVNHPGRSL